MGGTDTLLAARLAAGDDHALAEVFDRLAPAAYGAALRVLGNGAAAQDVVQDVFVELWSHPDRYDPAAGTLRTFLLVQARHRAADRTLDLVRAAGDPCAEVAVHGMRLPLSAVLVVRAFELWTHENDIRRAAGLPASVPDPSTLSLMTRLAARLLPHAAARTGLHEPVNVRLVLTGPGGGTWDIAVGESPPDPVSIRIIADAAGFCRLVANRATPANLDLHVTGDPGRAAGVLAAASALALD